MQNTITQAQSDIRIIIPTNCHIYQPVELKFKIHADIISFSLQYYQVL